MAETVCAVAVKTAAFAIDKLYHYRIPATLRGQVAVGCRVLVPFGRGNSRIEGVVLDLLDDQSDRKLKPITELLDTEPVISPDQLQLAVWMRERLYCTFFDCVRAMLPAGLWFRLRETYTLVGAIPDELPQEQKVVLKQFSEELPTRSLEELEAVLPDKNLTGVLNRLCEEGILAYQANSRQHTLDKTEQMLSLAIDREDAERRCSRGKSSVKLDVIALLAEGEKVSRKEVGYLTGASDAILRDMVKKGILQNTKAEVFRTPDWEEVSPAPSPVLSQEQQAAYEGMASLLKKGEGAAALLFGVTGSGKTQVYIKLIEDTLAMGRGAIVLVPEIGLTPQFIRTFAARFGKTVAVLHSALSAGERYDSWKKIRRGEARVVIGTRSAVFAPVQGLGLLILDEEQDSAYKSEQSPRYHARDIAKYRVWREKALLVLGSATPSIETYYGAQDGKYPMFCLAERFMGTALPEVRIADMRGAVCEGNTGVIGAVLEEEIRATLTNKKQAILFLNRRGNSRTIGCALCGWVPECPSCATTLTYHSANGRAMCHYCGYSVRIEGSCPSCGGRELFTETPGTQKVEQELQEKFPQARVLRMDADTTSTKNAHEKLLSAFAAGKADILLGTQMVTKGLDFERVTLVGVLDSDQSLYVQNYRARERTFALITQVVGRAGRRFDTGRAVIQTYSPTHPVILSAARQDYDQLYRSEIELRGALLCPPVEELLQLTAMGESEQQVLASLVQLKNRLESLMQGQFADFQYPVLGPAPAPVVRVMGKYRYHLIMRCPDNKRRRQLVAGVMREFARIKENRGISLFADTSPDI